MNNRCLAKDGVTQISSEVQLGLWPSGKSNLVEEMRRKIDFKTVHKFSSFPFR